MRTYIVVFRVGRSLYACLPFAFVQEHICLAFPNESWQSDIDRRRLTILTSIKTGMPERTWPRDNAAGADPYGGDQAGRVAPARPV